MYQFHNVTTLTITCVDVLFTNFSSVRLMHFNATNARTQLVIISGTDPTFNLLELLQSRT